MKKRNISILLTLVLMVSFLPMPIALASEDGVLDVGKIIDVSIGKGAFSDTVAAVTEDGKLYMWGDNAYGQIGVSPDEQDSFTTPVLVSAIKDVVSICIDEGFCLALTSDGKVYTWGNNWYGRTERLSGILGHGTDEEYKSTPAQVAALADEQIVAISAHYYGLSALTSTGDLYIWGATGNMSASGGSVRKNPYIPMCLDNAQGVSSSLGAKAVITTDEKLYFFPQGMDMIYPAYLDSYHLADEIVSFSIGGSNQCVLADMNGAVYTWTYSTIGSNAPEGLKIPTSNKVSQVAAGDYYFGAVTVTGELFTWGGSHEPLGQGNLGGGLEYDVSPTKVALDNVKQIALGDNTGAALTNDGKLYTWGKRSFGATGFGSSGDIYVPTLLFSAPVECTTHIYTSAGGDVCTQCGYIFKARCQDVNKYFYAVQKNVPVWSSPYSQSNTVVKFLAEGEQIYITRSFSNSIGSLWYVTQDGHYVFSEYFSSQDPVVGNTKVYDKDNSYLVVSCFDSKYIYSQTDPRWNEKFTTKVEGVTKNRGCVVTAEAIAVSMYRNKELLPTDMKFDSMGYKGFNRSLSGSNKLNEQQRLDLTYEKLNEGIPVILRLNGHSVVVVGFKASTSPESILKEDLLIIDPWNGRIWNLVAYQNSASKNRSIDCTTLWNLWVPTAG